MTGITLIDQHVTEVADAMPFPVSTFADMGGTGALQIDLGQRGGDAYPDTAGIDPDDDTATWFITSDGGLDNIEAPHTIDTDATVVAAWIAEQAFLLGCPRSIA